MTTDYSKLHELASDLFTLPKSAAEYEQFRLTDEQVDFYHREGYLSGIRLLSTEQVETLRHELAEFFSPEHEGRDLWYEYHTNESSNPDTVLFHALGAWRLRPAFHDILWNPAFTVAASQLLGGAVRFWHDQLFCKPAKHGGVVAWHQDYSYWTRTQPMAHLTCWIGLDDSRVDNGCLHYVPKSHLWPLLPITGLAGDMEAIQEVLSPEQWEQFQHPVAIELDAGCCSFHHPLLVHGSFENRTPRPRRATVINVMRDGVGSSSNDALLNGVPPVPAGTQVTGQFFPLLYDPQKN
ncbi:Phytanoyl-CoA dioxygenase [Pirellula staleyi DSM 6068]|uniref:Phytanoyl-CoA dioxygenase n=1 Tax=Pirellula staleyi (strain ATCC 27377 / DSM 6068 / ICPB 4128) TaxID=530564 RepID=D2R6Q3_PIRSD|nr:phytanoyl-CoA dioxygenase family protein [Pirellula staleyi]ADB17353.1 Phytanoyl-CoA dioxygenase [Pirellula staleyi DSM 6068]